ncbi:MAG: metal ABC transporter permease [Thermovibrio sp.]|nr:MAG: metal ABC transporter permease [Thermovibrio sp.]
MIQNPFIFLSYDFGINALISSVLAGLSCSLIGSYVVLRKMSFAGAGLSHVAFAGVAFGFLLGISPILSAFLFSVLASFVLWYFQTKKGLHFDTTMGIIFATSMALAVIFLSLSKTYGAAVLSYLFGSPLAVEKIDITVLALVSVTVLIFYILFWREIYLISFSEEIAKASGYNIELITLIMSFLVASVVTLSLKSVGALLVFSLLVIPSASAYKLAKSYFQYIIYSVLFGVLSGALGMLISFSLDAPSGATITLVSFLLFLLTNLKSQ